jgi:hypothetical protein
MTVMGNNFGIEARVAIGPDPNTGEVYYCNFTRPFEINSRDCQFEGKGYECLFCRLRAGGGAYPVTVWLAGQRSVLDVPFKFRGRAVGLTFHEQPSKVAPKNGLLEKQPKLKVIDDLNDNEPTLRPNEEYDFMYWVGPPGTYQEFNPDGYACAVEISRVPDSSNPLENPCSEEFEEEMKKDRKLVGTAKCFEADMPLAFRYKLGIGLQNRALFRSLDSGMVTFSDIQFTGHPAQRYNITFSIVDLGNALYVTPQTFSTSWVVDFQPCPPGQLGTYDRSCECARGFEVGGATGCQRCPAGLATSEGDNADEPGKYKPLPGQSSCITCPSQNQVTKNSTTRDSIGTCFCAKGFFRAAVLYDYKPAFVPEKAAPAACGGEGSYEITTELGDDPEVELRRRRRRSSSRQRGKRRQGSNQTEGVEAAAAAEEEDRWCEECPCVIGPDEQFNVPEGENMSCAEWNPQWFDDSEDAEEGEELSETSSRY